MSFLGVTDSVTGRAWVGPDLETDRLTEALSQQLGLSRPLAALLAQRGIDADGAEGFLTPRLRDLMPDPRSLRDMEKAAARLVLAVQTRQRIAIFGDYDVDGGASSALLIDWLRNFGLQATLYIPDRIDEGYGPNVPAMADLAARHDLIICVDCGTLSHEALGAATAADVIVLDHHLGGETLPPALAVVNPNRQDESGDLTYLCAAGVVFLALVEANRQLRAGGLQGPDLTSLLDLVALATVADVAPLVGLNRALVRQGLAVMGRRARPGLVALADVARIDSAPSSYHLGYILGPRVNAGGRIGRADLGARLLATTDPHEAAAMAAQLDALNTERRAIESAVRDAAIAQAEARGLEAPLVWAASEGWHPGVVGIVAARIKEATNRPSVVIGFDGGIGKGSGRSVSGVDLGAAIQRVAAEGLLLKGGGHKMAAGLTVTRENLEPAMARLSELLARQGAGAGGPSDLRIDALLMPGAATVAMIEQLEQAGPFGASAPAPRFALPDVVVQYVKPVGSDHLKVTLGDGLGARLDAIAFNAAQSPLGHLLTHSGSQRVHVVGRLEVNHWQGRASAQLRIEDAAKASS
ncbi:single-stranded-DNA-specific exonuclease RecJ [Ketogulonicigenium vulgare]|nr:single-stranded-DNA-specific exonuclease RecJ [Ketogulonicigenium vulgare]ADO43548.1 single-stranded-DNA-specific exonuclease RecJ [Ketogulonicigenium vulgare Y25]ALJ81932.1 single-stranded-DNA-specific exonuclease RecJ [Ketogulonicigenium vulgare]AOZ55583.1 single-stranded-DNA-specific exonuclease RecJ [Ketogulonicigenium vulgare]